MSARKKVLLMGRSGSGKTSMRYIIFSNYIARDTKRLGATIDIETANVKILGGLKLDLWDCGGQDGFMESFLTAQRDSMFSHVHSLIYIFDVKSLQFSTNDMRYFVDCLSAIKARSATASENGEETPRTMVHVLIHKLDLVALSERSNEFEKRKAEILGKCREIAYEDVEVYGTSIWDETLYGAWSKIVSSLIPNVHMLQDHLAALARRSSASEVVLFEKATFLVISRYTVPSAEAIGRWDKTRFDRICQAVKIFRLNCDRIIERKETFKALELRNATFTAVLDICTPTTYIMLVSTTTGAQPAGLSLNIQAERATLGKLETLSWGAV